MAIVGIKLAAGAATRMGRSKLLPELEGEALLHRSTRRSVEVGLDPVLVVLGHEALADLDLAEDLERARARLAPRSGA